MANYDELSEYIKLVEEACMREKALAETLLNRSNNSDDLHVTSNLNSKGNIAPGESHRGLPRIGGGTESDGSLSDSNPLSVPTDESRSVNGQTPGQCDSASNSSTQSPKYSSLYCLAWLSEQKENPTQLLHSDSLLHESRWISKQAGGGGLCFDHSKLADHGQLDGSYYVVSKQPDDNVHWTIGMDTVQESDDMTNSRDENNATHQSRSTSEQLSGEGQQVGILGGLLNKCFISQRALSEMFGEDEFENSHGHDTSEQSVEKDCNRTGSPTRIDKVNSATRARLGGKVRRLLLHTITMSVAQISSLLGFWATEKLLVDPDMTLRDMFLTNGSLNHTISLERLYDSILNGLRVLRLNLPYTSMIEMLLDLDRPGN